MQKGPSFQPRDLKARNVSKQGTQRVHRHRRQAMIYGNGFWDENGEMYPLDFLGGGGAE